MNAKELAEQYLPCTAKNCYKGCKAKGELFIDEFITELEALLTSRLEKERECKPRGLQKEGAIWMLDNCLEIIKECLT